MNVRRFKPGEEATLWELCRETTLRVNGFDYGTELVEMWAPEHMDMERWRERMHRKQPFVAEQEGTVVGFCLG